MFDWTGGAKWDSWDAAGKTYQGHTDKAETRYLEIARELGWSEDVSGATIPSEGGEPLDSSHTESTRSGGGGEGAGMGFHVSTMAIPDDEPGRETIHDFAVSGDVEHLKILLGNSPDIDVDILDEYVSSPFFLL